MGEEIAYLHLRHVAAFLSRSRLGCLYSHVQIILICHGNHVAIVFEFDLELVPYAKFLADRLPELGDQLVLVDEDVSRIA
jgi:hypothetical protein